MPPKLRDIRPKPEEKNEKLKIGFINNPDTKSNSNQKLMQDSATLSRKQNAAKQSGKTRSNITASKKEQARQAREAARKKSEGAGQ